MSKIRLTEKQAEALEQAKEGRGKDKVMNGIGGKWYRELEPLNDLTPSQMARALYIGYEVEPEFKKGDWVVWNKTHIREVLEEPENHYLRLNINGSPGGYYKALCRHATPEEIAEEKERRWWAKHGRDPWELRKGDSLIKSGETHYPGIVSKVRDFNVLFTDGYLLGKERIKENYRVFCFADDRKDVDNGRAKNNQTE